MVWINGTLIQKHRTDKGLTRRDLGVILNVSQETIRVWETYPSKINPRNLKRIGLIFGIDPEILKIIWSGV